MTEGQVYARTAESLFPIDRVLPESLRVPLHQQDASAAEGDVHIRNIIPDFVLKYKSSLISKR